MPTTTGLPQRIAEEAAMLPLERQNEVLDFVLFVKQRLRDDDEAWERTLADGRARPRLDAFLRASAAEGEEPAGPGAAVISSARPSFWRALGALDPTAREAARRAYRLFAADPGHPSLRFKKLAGRDDVWSVRINQQYRAVGERHGEKVVWFWIGSHNEFDHLFN